MYSRWFKNGSNVPDLTLEIPVLERGSFEDILPL